MKIAPHRLVLGSLAVLSIALTGCSGEENHHHGAADPTTSSSSAAPSTSSAPAATSAAPSATGSPAASSSTPSTSSSAPDPDAEAAVASPGTSCGPVGGSGEGTVYVDGGPVGCAEAKRITRTYLQGDSGTSKGGHRAEQIEGYGCTSDRGAPRPLEGRNAVCVNASTGAYLDVRPSDLRILKGPIAEPVDYMTGSGLGKEEYTGGSATFFTTPDGSAGCGIDVKDTLDCWSMSQKDLAEWKSKGATPYQHVHLSKDGAVSTEIQGQQDRRVELAGKALDEGTVMNAMTYSCQAISASQMHCVSPSHGFTLSEQGVVED